MKEFFEKIWKAIKNPVCIAAVILLVALFLFCTIDGIIRCFHKEIFYGIVQILMCGAAAPTLYITCLGIINEIKRKLS